MNEFIEKLDDMIVSRKKITSPLYSLIMNGDATQELLQNFIIHRYPVKNLWTRHLMSIASRIDDYDLRRSLLENAFEEETGYQTNSKRHLESFVDVGLALGLSRDEIVNGPIAEETKALMQHNWDACNNTKNHFTTGVACVIYLMEAQPPIVNRSGKSMEYVMRNVYKLPKSGYDYFTHHASATESDERKGPSELEDQHAAACREILSRYCNTEELQENALSYTDRALKLRHAHFTMIYEKYHHENKEAYCYA